MLWHKLIIVVIIIKIFSIIVILVGVLRYRIIVGIIIFSLVALIVLVLVLFSFLFLVSGHFFLLRWGDMAGFCRWAVWSWRRGRSWGRTVCLMLTWVDLNV